MEKLHIDDLVFENEIDKSQSILDDPTITIRLFNNNIAILESKIIYFCLRSNFRGSTTLMSQPFPSV